MKIKYFFDAWWLPVSGGFIFLFFFYYGYSNINPDFYTLRDDGIITLSHAKNLVDYGFIGVGPSGERVEGYSAPVQFLIYALIYFLTGIGFAAYANAQTIAGTFFLGFIFTLFFKENKVFSLLASLLTAFLLTKLTSFIQWHGSGMENAVTHVLFALTAYILFSFAKNKRIDLRLSFIPFLASISRLDGIYHILPLLLIFAFYWIVFEKSKKGVVFLILSTLLWLIYNSWRYFYFGDLIPNTAYAQGISVGDRIMAIVQLDKGLINSSFHLANKIFSAHGGYFIFVAIPLIILARWQKSYALLLAISASIILTAFFNPFFFGPTRLDVTRSTTQMAFFVVVAIATIIYSIRGYRSLIMITLLIPAGIFVHRLNYIAPYNMCCIINGFDHIRKEFAQVAEREQIPRPTVSNPDLGVMSWYKQFNIVDLGMLGSQVMAKLKNGPLLADYFFDYAAPDIFESHEYWTCRYFETIFSDSRFRERYSIVREEKVIWDGCPGKILPVGIWVRNSVLKNSDSAERKLIDDLARSLDISRIESELKDCQSRESFPENCTYIARSAYRFLPEFRASGIYDELINTFSSSRTRDFDMFLLEGFRNGRANEKAIVFISENHLSKAGVTKITGGNGFDVYLTKNGVFYINRSCKKSATKPRFYLHAIPSNIDDMYINDKGFINLDFSFNELGVKIGRYCVAARSLPQSGISSIRTGQFNLRSGMRVWESNFSIEEKPSVSE